MPFKTNAKATYLGFAFPILNLVMSPIQDLLHYPFSSIYLCICVYYILLAQPQDAYNSISPILLNIQVIHQYPHTTIEHITQTCHIRSNNRIMPTLINPRRKIQEHFISISDTKYFDEAASQACGPIFVAMRCHGLPNRIVLIATVTLKVRARIIANNVFIQLRQREIRGTIFFGNRLESIQNIEKFGFAQGFWLVLLLFLWIKLPKSKEI